MEYLTMICDIKNSKQLKNREEVQYFLIDMLKEANIKFASLLASKFIITLGDEWQGLLYYPCDYTALVNYFHEKLDSIDFYCGIGIGEVSINNFELTVNQLDGPSFHKAREALQYVKQQKHSIVIIH